MNRVMIRVDISDPTVVSSVENSERKILARFIGQALEASIGEALDYCAEKSLEIVWIIPGIGKLFSGSQQEDILRLVEDHGIPVIPW